MEKLTETEKQRIISVLRERNANLPCPRCGNNNFTLLDGYFNQTIQNEFRGIVIGGPSVPSVVIACNRCGFLSQHALGVLGLLPKEDEDKKEQKE
jgi:hypothetical protein